MKGKDCHVWWKDDTENDKQWSIQWKEGEKEGNLERDVSINDMYLKNKEPINQESIANKNIKGNIITPMRTDNNIILTYYMLKSEVTAKGSLRKCYAG